MRVAVKDHIEIRSEYQNPLGPGLVVTFDFPFGNDLLPDLDDAVHLIAPDGYARVARIAEMKDLGAGRGFVFANLTRADVPLGSHIEWPDRRLGPRTVDEVGRIRLVRSVAPVEA